MLGRRAADGATEGDHAASAARQLAALGSPIKPKIIEDVPEMPWQLDYLWRWWLELAMGRSSGGFGIAHLSWVDLDAWCRMTGTDLHSWEVACLMDVDSLWCAAQSKKLPKTTK